MSDKKGIIITENKEELKEKTSNMLDRLLSNKIGGKRSKKGGVYVTCDKCGTNFNPDIPEKGKGKCPNCELIRLNRGRERKKLRSDRSRSNDRAIRRHKRRAKSPFDDVAKQVALKKGESPTPKLTALRGYITELGAAWNNGTLTIDTLAPHLTRLANMQNTLNQEQRDLSEYNWALRQYYFQLVIWCILELLFYAIGAATTMKFYEESVWLSNVIINAVEQIFPTYYRKKIQRQAEREERDAQIAINIMNRDRQIRLRRRIQEGIRNNPNIEETERDELISRFDDENALVPPTSIDRNPEPSTSFQSPTGWRTSMTNGFRDFANNIEDFMNKRSDALTANHNRLKDSGEDFLREVTAPFSASTELFGEIGRFIAEVLPLITVLLVVIKFFKITRKTWREQINSKPVPPFHPDDPRRDPKGDGRGPGTTGAPKITTDGTHEGGRRKRRKKTRKKRRKTRRKSKKRKSKRRRKNRKTKRRKRRR